MRRVIAVALIAPLAYLAACEGEPPVNSPENAMGAAPAAPSASPAPAESAAMPTMSAMPAMGTAPMRDGGASGAAAAPLDAGTVESAPTEAVTAAPTKYGNIVGAVAAQPAAIGKNAIVYLERHPGDTSPAAQTVTIDNRQMNFIPYVQVAAVGAKVVFANSDPFPHNIFSPDNEKFNLGNVPQSGAHAHTFDHPGAYTLLCNLHPGMIGYLLVVPSTHFVRVDANGKFAMKGVPVGTYDVSVWAPRLKPVTQSVTVTEGTASANFQLHR